MIIRNLIIGAASCICAYTIGVENSRSNTFVVENDINRIDTTLLTAKRFESEIYEAAQTGNATEIKALLDNTLNKDKCKYEMIEAFDVVFNSDLERPQAQVLASQLENSIKNLKDLSYFLYHIDFWIHGDLVAKYPDLFKACKEEYAKQKKVFVGMRYVNSLFDRPQADPASIKRFDRLLLVDDNINEDDIQALCKSCPATNEKNNDYVWQLFEADNILPKIQKTWRHNILLKLFNATIPGELEPTFSSQLISSFTKLLSHIDTESYRDLKLVKHLIGSEFFKNLEHRKRLCNMCFPRYPVLTNDPTIYSLGKNMKPIFKTLLKNDFFTEESLPDINDPFFGKSLLDHVVYWAFVQDDSWFLYQLRQYNSEAVQHVTPLHLRAALYSADVNRLKLFTDLRDHINDPLDEHKRTALDILKYDFIDKNVVRECIEYVTSLGGKTTIDESNLLTLPSGTQVLLPPLLPQKD